ncbi:hypothetical protein FEM48_Zijuj03G0130500 [Ziziphus jujuba var. spinosa]|uniref:Uncharacterized protein n=1 Tax=Ziziphus jujuba var. spinosa TaxID=714518 RepID=A0A978VQG4_ZIZJJ|nr:hypothetical protein FEM48_Zijuj03G0130500 [Ziziphus jujuba var. spinosa]
MGLQDLQARKGIWEKKEMELELTANVDGAEVVFQLSLVGKLITNKIIQRSAVQILLRGFGSPSTCLPLLFMTKDNAIKIGGLFEKVLHCETSSHANIIGMNISGFKWKLMFGHVPSSATLRWSALLPSQNLNLNIGQFIKGTWV